jgi:hypothetical protein
MNRLTFSAIFLSGALFAILINVLSHYIKTQSFTSIQPFQSPDIANHYLKQNAFYPLPDEGHIRVSEDRSTLETVIHNLQKVEDTAKPKTVTGMYTYDGHKA